MMFGLKHGMPAWVAAIAALTVFLAVMKLLGPETCRDGWASASIGHQGACSWHKGVSHLHFTLSLIATVVVTTITWVGTDVVAQAVMPSTWSGKAASDVNLEPERKNSVRCGACGSALKRRVATRGINKGNYFMGCSTYPRCRAVRPLSEEEAAWGTRPAINAK